MNKKNLIFTGYGMIIQWIAFSECFTTAGWKFISHKTLWCHTTSSSRRINAIKVLLVLIKMWMLIIILPGNIIWFKSTRWWADHKFNLRWSSYRCCCVTVVIVIWIQWVWTQWRVTVSEPAARGTPWCRRVRKCL